MAQNETIQPDTSQTNALRAELLPVLTNGLRWPLLVTNAHDGSHRLFILEQPGRVRVLQPGSDSPTIFLDIKDRVFTGGERGLLGLAFHPDYAANGRFFISYTRKPDAALVIAEYSVSALDPDLAEPLESVLLVVAQPAANHNGGMIEFGHDGFLYIATGDGGPGNDPGDRAQNPLSLLGKILRIDVDHMQSVRRYSIPSDNPFVGSTLGLDEIYALGFRNPWRFSFDRLTGRLYAGDVGQGQVEEVDVITLGGNYGWRVFEGSRCTDLGPAPCSAGGFVPPVAEYWHTSGRCSVTGGYVYRGSRGTLPYGSYVFGDFCTGEIFLLSAESQGVLLDTDLRISSFGEDESGEIYVMGLRGSVHRIVNPDAPSLPTYYFPRLATDGVAPAARAEYLGIAAANHDSVEANLTFTARDSAGSLIEGEGIGNPAAISLQDGEQLARLAGQIFGDGFFSIPRSGWVRLESTSKHIVPFFLVFNPDLSVMDGAVASSIPLTVSILPELEADGFSQIHVVNPHRDTAEVRIQLIGGNGLLRDSMSRDIDGMAAFSDFASEIFPNHGIDGSDYLKVQAAEGVVAFEYLGKQEQHTRGLNGIDATIGANVLFAPQYVVGGMYGSHISLVNLEAFPGSATLRFFGDDGRQRGVDRIVTIPAFGKILVEDSGFFGNFDDRLTQGYVEIRSTRLRLAGSISYHDVNRDEFGTALELVSVLHKRLILSHVASNSTYFTGLVIVNPNDKPTDVVIEVYDREGRLLDSTKESIQAGARKSGVLTEYFPGLTGMDVGSGYITVTSEEGIVVFGVFGTHTMSILSAIPAVEMQ
jgi:glucose/arabinose dehydrogenase